MPTSRLFVVWLQGTTAEEESGLYSQIIPIRFGKIIKPFLYFFPDTCSELCASHETSHSALWFSDTFGLVFWSVPTSRCGAGCAVSAVYSFQWTRHIMQGGGACWATALPSAYALFVPVSTDFKRMCTCIHMVFNIPGFCLKRFIIAQQA